jgi:hypothetical protein
MVTSRGTLGDGTFGAVAESDQRERFARRRVEMALPGEIAPRVPAHLVESE